MRTANYRRHDRARGPGPGYEVRIVADSRYGGVCAICHSGVTFATVIPIGRVVALHGNPPPRFIEHDPDMGTIDVLTITDLHAGHCPEPPTWIKRG